MENLCDFMMPCALHIIYYIFYRMGRPFSFTTMYAIYNHRHLATLYRYGEAKY